MPQSFKSGTGGYGGGRFHYSEDGQKPNISRVLLKKIARYFLPYWKLLILLSISIIITSVLGLLPPIFIRNIIDVALPQKDINLLIIFILSSFGAVLLSGLFAVGQSYLNSWIAKYIIYDIRNSMYNHLQYMSMRFFSEVKTGDITSLVNNDIGGIESIFSNTLVHIVQNIFIFLITAGTMFYTNWKLALVAMMILPLFVLPTRKVGKIRWKIASQVQERLADLNHIIHETLNINGTMLVKLFTREKQQEQKFEQVNQEVTRLTIKESLAGRWFFMAISSVVAIGPMIIYLVGGLMLIRYDSITIGSIVMFVALLGRLYSPVTSFANISVDITRSAALFERIFNYLNIEHEIKDRPHARALKSVKGEVRFNQVSFSYNQKTVHLENINIAIEPGQLVAFVGPSGAGKTTLTYLLPRFYDVGSGSITIDGYDIRDVTLESLRQNIGMVTQDTYLFNDSIGQNLLFANPDAGTAQLHQACKIANIHQTIMALPQGYDTIVGERGIKLSGGEKQRLSIARVLLKDPQIVILDEATSSLDSISEALIQEAIEPLLKGRTSLVIAHRLSTILAADCIYVISKGKIVDAGTHQHLLSVDGIYQDLYNRQFKNSAKPGPS
ncbi:MAG: ABC transporter ATP-binding protein [Actinomycetota bacterium]|nr:ABC transporter ATP-binding protein [Actinomycetota bacterium]